MTQKQSTLTPKLRFPEFGNDPTWTPVTLRDVSVPVEEKVGDRKLTPVSISAGIGFVPQAEKFGRDISGNQYKQYTVVRNGDFVYNKGNSLRFPQGCIYQLRDWGEVAAPNVFICFRLKEGYSDGFFQSCFEKNIHGIQLQRHITSGARSNGLLNISRDTFFDIQIPTPSLAEQQKIAECLSTLDELIEAERRKLDALKDHKKGLMQQLFPREGETRPRLRFAEFRASSDWERGVVRNIATVLQGYGFPEKYQGNTSAEFPFYKVSDISRTLAAGRHLMDEAANYIDHETLEKLKAKPIPAGTTIFAKIGEALRLNRRALTTRPCLIDNNTAGVKAIEEKATDLFLYYLFSTISLEKHAGGVVPAVSKTAIEEIEILYPKRDEQARIATFLSSIDDLIAAQSERLEALRAHKRGLMQQLFPNPSEFES